MTAPQSWRGRCSRDDLHLDPPLTAMQRLGLLAALLAIGSVAGFGLILIIKGMTQ